jgi:hypothetical protein
MAHGQSYSDSQRKIIDRYYDNKDTIATQKLGELVSDLYLTTDAKKADQLWDRAAKALANITVNRARVDKVLTDRKVEALAQLVNELALSAKAAPSSTTSPASSSATAAPVSAPASTPAASPAAAATPGSYSHEELKTALKAFKKRLKLTKLDEESKLGHSPLSSGRGSGIIAIQPPNQYPSAIWQELVKQGKLKPAGRGFFELIEQG